MKTKPKEMVQYCIDAQHFVETIRAIPKSINIDSIAFKVGNPLKRTKRCSIPNRLRRLGVLSGREVVATTVYVCRISGLSRTKLIKLAKELENKTGEDMETFRVIGVNLSFGASSAIFKQTTKAIHPDETDQRKKLKVLGLSSSEGNVADMIRELSAKKYSCKFERTFTDNVICSEMSR